MVASFGEAAGVIQVRTTPYFWASIVQEMGATRKIDVSLHAGFRAHAMVPVCGRYIELIAATIPSGVDVQYRLKGHE
jgi:hypothetical protein